MTDRCPTCGADAIVVTSDEGSSHYAPYATDSEAAAREILTLRHQVRLAHNARLRVVHDRDRWIRLFNRLEAAISHHKRSDHWKESEDAALYKARDKILRDAAAPSSDGPSDDPARETAPLHGKERHS